MIFPFFPFLFWRFWVCEGNTLMRYCRNDFSLFFPFSVFPSKSFFFIFLFYFLLCVIVSFGEKKTKNYFFGGKREKGKNIVKKFSKHLCFILKTWKWDFSLFFPFFPFLLERFSFNKETKKKKGAIATICFLCRFFSHLKLRAKTFTQFSFNKETQRP